MFTQVNKKSVDIAWWSDRTLPEIKEIKGMPEQAANYSLVFDITSQLSLLI